MSKCSCCTFPYNLIISGLVISLSAKPSSPPTSAATDVVLHLCMTAYVQYSPTEGTITVIVPASNVGIVRCRG